MIKLLNILNRCVRYQTEFCCFADATFATSLQTCSNISEAKNVQIVVQSLFKRNISVILYICSQYLLILQSCLAL